MHDTVLLRGKRLPLRISMTCYSGQLGDVGELAARLAGGWCRTYSLEQKPVVTSVWPPNRDCWSVLPWRCRGWGLAP